MNNLNFTGNIGRDCETRYTAGGDAITSFSVALTSGFGEKKLTSWMNCSMFGKRGEAVAPYLKKGTQVAISGEFSARPYTNKEGVEKISLDVRVNDLTLLGGKSTANYDDSGMNQDAERQSAPRQAPAAAPSQAPASKPAGSGFDDFEDDIPF